MMRAPCERVLVMLGRYAEARQEATLLSSAFPDTARFRAELGVVAALAGDRDRAMQVDAELSTLSTNSIIPDPFDDPAYLRARLAAARADTARAVAQLGTLQARSAALSAMVEEDPAFVAIRHSAALRALLVPQE